MSEASEPTTLQSSAEGRLQKLRHNLILELYLRRGPLWEAVRDVRARWNITAKAQLPPPPVRGWLLPDDAPDFDDREKYHEYADQWQEEMFAVKLKVAPEPYARTRDWSDYLLDKSWLNFLAACVLCDPPEAQLIEFASYANLEPMDLSDGRHLNKRGLKELPEMVDPPVKLLWGLTELKDWYWERILKHIGEQYLEPQDVDVETLLENPTLHVPGLREEYREK